MGKRWNALWYGGVNYAMPEAPMDTETFGSLYEAEVEMKLRRNNGTARLQRPNTPVGVWEHARTPVVSEASVMWLWKGDPGEFPETGIRIYFGPRGGIRREAF